MQLFDANSPPATTAPATTERKEEGSSWDLLPIDVQALILSQTNVPSLFAVRSLDRRSKRLVQEFLQNVSSLKLLRLLPFPEDHRSSKEMQQQEWVGQHHSLDYINARKQVLNFQSLVRLHKIAPRWKKIRTIEEGILALMTRPTHQLDEDKLLCLRGIGEPLPSEALNSEVFRLSKLFGEQRIQQITAHIQLFYNQFKIPDDTDQSDTPDDTDQSDTPDDTDQSDTPDETPDDTIVTIKHPAHITLLAVMILRTSCLTEVQDQLTEVFCIHENDIYYPLKEMYTYALKKNNSALLTALKWLTQDVGDDVCKSIDSLKEAPAKDAIDKIIARLIYLLAKPNSFDGELRLESFNDEFQPILLGTKKHDYSYYYNQLRREGNYTSWNCALIFNSWEIAQNLLNTIAYHVPTPTHPLGQRLDNMRCFSVYFKNDSLRTIKGSPNCFYTDLSGAIFSGRSRKDRNSITTRFDHSVMDDVCISNQWLDRARFKNMTIQNLLSLNAEFNRVEFCNVRLSQSDFTGSKILSSKFYSCRFDKTVNFNHCDFSCSTNKPSVFQDCELDARSFEKALGVVNVRFINCRFVSDITPINCVNYITENKDTNTAEHYHQLFILASKRSDSGMIEQLQGRLLSLISEQTGRYDKGEWVYEVTQEQDQICREVFSYQTNMLSWLVNKVSMGHCPPLSLNEYEEHARIVEQPRNNQFDGHGM